MIADRMQMTLPEPASAAAPAPEQDVPHPDIPRLLAAFSRRAARVPLPGKEQTEKEQAREFAALHALGFNEVWLQIVPGPPNTDKDLLRRVREAVTLGKKIRPDRVSRPEPAAGGSLRLPRTCWTGIFWAAPRPKPPGSSRFLTPRSQTRKPLLPRQSCSAYRP